MNESVTGPTSPPEAGQTPSDSMVIWFSRTGSTKVMADVVAGDFGSRKQLIEARKYTPDFSGMMRASWDTVGGIAGDIQPKQADFGTSKMIFLGSPIWWGGISVPMLTLAEKCDFSGKDVVIFGTYNTGINPAKVKAFQGLIEKRGGRFLDQIFIKVGLFKPLSAEEITAETRAFLNTRRAGWK